MIVTRGTKVKVLAIRNKHLEASLIGQTGFVVGTRINKEKDIYEHVVEVDGMQLAPFLGLDLEVLPE